MRQTRPASPPVRLRRRGVPAAVFAAAALALLFGGGCSEEAVCPQAGEGEHVVVVVSTSRTDYAANLELAPIVAKRAANRAARSCGRLTVGIQDGRPEANLELRSIRLRPDQETAYNAERLRTHQGERGEEFAQKRLLEPLESHGATNGSPFFASMVQVGREIHVHEWPPATLALVGDGTVVERPPNGGPMIRFGAREGVSRQDVESFVAPLRSLRGSCVMLVGAGADSGLPGRLIRESQTILSETLAQAGVGFVATRSAELPRRC